MPTETTRGTRNETSTQRTRQQGSTTQRSSSTQGGFSSLLVDDPSGLESALDRLVLRFFDQASATDDPGGIDPTDAALSAQIQEETFGRAESALNRTFDRRNETLTANLANSGAIASSAEVRLRGDLGREQSGLLADVASQGATASSERLLRLNESSRNRAFQRRSLAAGLGGQALAGVTQLGQLRASLGTRLFEQTSDSSQVGSQQSFSQADMERLESFFQSRKIPFNPTALFKALGTAAGGRG